MEVPTETQTKQSSMDEIRKIKVLLCTTILLIVLAFIFMVTSIFTPYWYKVFPEMEDQSMGTFGLLERCGPNDEGFAASTECFEREEILKFDDTSWPYQPLKSKDFDVILLVLILSMMTSFLAVALSLLIYCSYCNEGTWRRYVLLALSIISALLGISGTAYFENKDKYTKYGGFYEHGWSSYLAWAAVFTLILVNVPVFYLCWLCYRQPAPGRTEYTTTHVENHYEVIYERRNIPPGKESR